jgi:SHS2 domain-containing protein
MKARNDKFEIIEEGATADFVFEAYGETLNQLFANCAEACFFAMTDIERVEPVKEFNILVDGDNIDELLFSFIAELIYLKDTEKIFFSRFDVDVASDEKSLKAVVTGDHIDYIDHVIKTDVKAVTFHSLQIKKDDYGYTTRVILDL